MRDLILRGLSAFLGGYGAGALIMGTYSMVVADSVAKTMICTEAGQQQIIAEKARIEETTKGSYEITYDGKTILFKPNAFETCFVMDSKDVQRVQAR